VGKWAADLLLFVFPVHCVVCGRRLDRAGDILCIACEYNLPRTGYTRDPDNEVSRIFWGRTRVEMAVSLFHYDKASGYHQLIHGLKYRRQPRIGRYLGRLLGIELSGTPMAMCDFLVPVPLHPLRLRRRGYNQSECIATGIADITGTPVDTGILQRPDHHDSQTSLGRYERYMNVKDDFRMVPGAPDLNGSSILLVDDVITTGATLEACASVLLSHGDCRIFVATACCA